MGRGCESWVWVSVNVVGKKIFQKNKIKIKRKKAVKFMTRKSPRTYSPFPQSAKQISESFSTNGH